MTAETLPLFRSQLPSADRVRPYLEAIDANRQHSNFGPLETALTRALADHFGQASGTVQLTANGSLGLLHALLAVTDMPKAPDAPGGLVAMPSWTYAATPAVVSAAGFTPWFVDVDRDTWALDPGALAAALKDAPGPVAAVVVVAPFGCPADVDAWDGFADDTGVPVVIDAANGFDTLRVGRAPTMVSLHATKTFGVGEGGLVASTDTELIARVRQRANHGFTGPATAGRGGLNAKLSEIAAAYGLAALDEWPETRAAYGALRRAYGDALAPVSEMVPGLAPAPAPAAGHAVSTLNVVLAVESAPVIQALNARDIGARKWWAEGCHRQPAYARCPRLGLAVSEHLAGHALGLPFYLGLDADDIARVAGALADTLAGAPADTPDHTSGGA